MHKGQQRDATRNHEVRTHLIEGINKKTAKLSEQLQIHGIKPSSRSTAPQSRSTNPVATILDYEDAMNCKLSNGILPYINAPRREDGIVCTTKSSESNFESSESMNEKATNREDVGHDQCTQRQLLIRSAGGRKALIDKLKKIRSPRIKQLS